MKIANNPGGVLVKIQNPKSLSTHPYVSLSSHLNVNLQLLLRPPSSKKAHQPLFLERQFTKKKKKKRQLLSSQHSSLRFSRCSQELLKKVASLFATPLIIDDDGVTSTITITTITIIKALLKYHRSPLNLFIAILHVHT